MHTPVSHKTAGIIPKPAKGEMKTIWVKGSHRCWTEPTFIIDTCGYGRIGFYIERLFPINIAPHFYRTDITKLAGMHKVNRIFKMLLASLPLTSLNHTAGLFLRLYHAVTFFN